jgi:hypothetical protein
VRDNEEAGKAALSKWQEAIPWLQKLSLFPKRIDGTEIKDPNDLGARLPEGVGQWVFADLCKRHKIG